MTRLTSKLLTTAALLLAATTAVAHPGHDHGGFSSGLLHPILGLDHLLAMAAIGFWSIRQIGMMQKVTPLFVLGGMLFGAAIAWVGIAMPGVETGIVLSVMLAGVLIATLAKLPAAVSAPLVVAFMLFHGHAHAMEMPAGAGLVAYMVGLSIATLAIAYAGHALGQAMLKADNRVVRGIGAAIVGVGGVMMVG